MSQSEDPNHLPEMEEKFLRFKHWLAIKWRIHLASNLGIAFTSFGTGLLIAIVLKLPLIPWSIPKDEVPIFTSCASAFIGAGLAAIVAWMTLVRGDEETRKTVADVILEVASPLAAIGDALKRKDKDLADDETFNQIKAQFSLLDEVVKHATKRLDLLSSSHTQIRFGRGIAIPDAKFVIDDLSKSLTTVTEALDTDRAHINKLKDPLPKYGNYPTNNAETSFEKALQPQLQKLDKALLKLGHPRSSSEQKDIDSKEEKGSTWILGKMSHSEATLKLLYGSFAPFVTSLVAGWTLSINPRWKAISISIITSNTNTPLLKVAFGAGLILFPIAVILQLFRVRFFLYQFFACFMRLIIDAISSTVFTCACVISGVLVALACLSFHQPNWRASLGSALGVILLMLITNFFAYWSSKICHNPGKYLLKDDQKNTRARWLFVVMALTMIGLGFRYLNVDEKFCDVPTIKHAAGECPSPPDFQ